MLVAQYSRMLKGFVKRDGRGGARVTCLISVERNVCRITHVDRVFDVYVSCSLIFFHRGHVPSLHLPFAA